MHRQPSNKAITCEFPILFAFTINIIIIIIIVIITIITITIIITIITIIIIIIIITNLIKALCTGATPLTYTWNEFAVRSHEVDAAPVATDYLRAMNS